MAIDRAEAQRVGIGGAGAAARDVVTALVCGQIAGLMMAVTMMLVAVARGMNAFAPIAAISAIVSGESGIPLDAVAVLEGLLVHQLGFTLFWSIVFAAFVRYADHRNSLSVTAIALDERYGTAVLGVLVGMASNIIDVIIVMPAIAQDATWTEMFLGLKSWLYHFVFGLGLGTFPWVRKWLFGKMWG